MKDNNNIKYKDFSFTVHDPIEKGNKIIVQIDDEFVGIVDDIEFGCTYLYEIFTHEGNRLTKDGLPFSMISYTLPPIDIFSIVSDLSIGNMPRVELTRETEYFLLSKFNNISPYTPISPDIEK